MQKTPPHIGLISQGGEHWIAGILYIHTLIRTLSLLPPEERPKLTLLLGPTATVSLYEELGEDLPPIKHYLYPKKTPLKSWPKAQYRTLQKGTWGTTLETTIHRAKIDVLFPCMDILSDDFLIPWIYWIPDFRHKRMPQTFPEEECRARSKRLRKAVDTASHIILNSQDGYKDLMRWFKTDPQKVDVYHYPTLPVDSWYKPDPQSVADRYHLPEKFLIFPSQFWKHKNHLNLFKAVLRLKNKGRHDITVVLTGSKKDIHDPEYGPSLEAYIREHDLEKNILHLGLIPREDLIQLHRRSMASIQPSYFEGWGMLVEDSRALGKKIYLADIPINREQDPKDAVYFNPDNFKEIAAIIEKDWDRLKPGPDLEKERAARQETEERALGYARHFMDIILRSMP